MTNWAKYFILERSWWWWPAVQNVEAADVRSRKTISMCRNHVSPLSWHNTRTMAHCRRRDQNSISKVSIPYWTCWHGENSAICVSYGWLILVMALSDLEVSESKSAGAPADSSAFQPARIAPSNYSLLESAAIGWNRLSSGRELEELANIRLEVEMKLAECRMCSNPRLGRLNSQLAVFLLRSLSLS